MKKLIASEVDFHVRVKSNAPKAAWQFYGTACDSMTEARREAKTARRKWPRVAIIRVETKQYRVG